MRLIYYPFVQLPSPLEHEDVWQHLHWTPSPHDSESFSSDRIAIVLLEVDVCYWTIRRCIDERPVGAYRNPDGEHSASKNQPRTTPTSCQRIAKYQPVLLYPWWGVLKLITPNITTWVHTEGRHHLYLARSSRSLSFPLLKRDDSQHIDPINSSPSIKVRLYVLLPLYLKYVNQ
jgi:hypothetical protein